jgi:RIO kinase 1
MATPLAKREAASPQPAARDVKDTPEPPGPWVGDGTGATGADTGRDAGAYPALTQFAEHGLVAEVVSLVKSGKEATVYCCRTRTETGPEFVAAKVYRERANRAFKNDAVYWAGVSVGKRREQLAFKKKTGVGRELQASQWPAREYETLSVLHAAGADVPAPIMVAGGVLLMEFFGDEQGAAPQLQHVVLPRDEVASLYQRVLDNIALWLAHHRVHADLSAFNILYWRGTVRVIDFPQAVDPRQNPDAWDLLQRDLQNVHRYFARYGIEDTSAWLTQDLRRQYTDPSYRP